MPDDFLGAMELAQQQEARRSAPIPTPSTDWYAEWPIHGGLVALVDQDTIPMVRPYKWYNCKGYAVAHTPMVKGRRGLLRMHRVIMGAKDGQIVDHINGNPLDNRKCNLRFVTICGNNQNRAGINGCYFNRGKWQSRIIHNGKFHYLGVFDTKAEAMAVRRAKEAELGFLSRSDIHG